MKTITYQKAKDSFFLAAQVEGRSQQTLNLYHYVLSSFESYLQGKSLLEVEPIDVRRYLLHLSDSGYKKATIATHHKELRVFYNFLANEGHIETNPMQGIKQPKLPRVYPYVLSEEEVQKLLRVARGKTFEAKRNFCILITFLDTGMRVSELTGLTLEDMSLATYTMKVRGKGEKERTVHFSKETAKALLIYIKARGFVPHEDSFFISKAGEPLTRNGVLQMVKRLAKRAEIANKRVSPHTLRHTAATFWIKNGGDTVSLRRQLGHVDQRMVDVYVNLVGRDLREAHRKYSPVQRILGRR